MSLSRNLGKLFALAICFGSLDEEETPPFSGLLLMGFIFLCITQKEHVSSGWKNIPIILCLEHLQNWFWRLGQGKPQLWDFAAAPRTDAKADGRAGIICRNAPDLQCEGRVKGIADIAETARLIGSTLPGAAKATNSSHSAPQTETWWMVCEQSSSLPLQFVIPFSDRHSFGALPGNCSDAVCISNA